MLTTDAPSTAGNSAPPPRHAERLAVSIVAWKGADLTIDCLRSVEPEVRDVGNCHIYVVDNASPDGAADQVELAIAANGWSAWATLIRSPRNGGFAAGNNIVVRTTLAEANPPDYVLLLNPDTVVRPGAFRILLDFMRSHPSVGIAGGLSEDPDTTPQCCSFRFPNIVGEPASYLRLGFIDKIFGRYLINRGIPTQACEVDWVSGAYVMIRRQVFEDIGVMDEGYFLYFEETDFILRARRAGWPCWHVPQSRIVHLVGQSSGVGKRAAPPARVPAYWFESRRRYFVLNHGRAYAALTDLLVLGSLVVTRLRRIVQPQRDVRPPFFSRDFLQHSAIRRGRDTLKPRATAR